MEMDGEWRSLTLTSLRLQFPCFVGNLQGNFDFCRLSSLGDASETRRIPPFCDTDSLLKEQGIYDPDKIKVAAVVVPEPSKESKLPPLKEILALKGHRGGIWQLVFSADGMRLASNDNYVVQLWDLDARRAIGSVRAPVFTRSIVMPDRE